MIKTKPVFHDWPEARIYSHVSFTPTYRIAHLEIMRWMKHGSILTWVENFTENAGGIDGIRAKNLVAREIMMTGKTLAKMLD